MKFISINSLDEKGDKMKKVIPILFIFFVFYGYLNKEEISEQPEITIDELREKAKDLKIKGASKMSREELEDALKGKDN